MQRNLVLDIVKIILAIMVVGLHSNFMLDINKHVNYLTVNGIFRVAVPIFFVINGFYFFNISDKTKLKKWIGRIGILYCFWMVLYSSFWLQEVPVSTTEFLGLVITVIFGYHHLWYLVAMIGAGLVLYYIKNESNRFILIAAISLFLIGVLFEYLGNFRVVDNEIFNKLFNYLPFYRNFLFFGFPFFSIGYLINSTDYQNKMDRRKLLQGLLIGSTLLFVESYLNLVLNPRHESVDLFFSLIILAPLVFILSQKFYYKHSTKKISDISTAIYLVHPFFIFGLTSYTKFSITVVSILTLLLATGIGYVITIMNKKIKWLL